VAPNVRIGAHTGDAFENDGDANAYGGEAVHIAARIGAAAGAGEILASRETLESAGSGFRVSNPRSESLKGFEHPVDVISVDWR
jgi:class 3 adenylate cyclase